MYEFISSKVIEKKVYPSVIDLDISKHKMVDIYSMFVPCNTYMVGYCYHLFP